METFSAQLAICAGNSPVPGEFPAQRPVTRSFDVFFDLRLNKRLSKQPWGWWFETPAWSLWRHRNDTRAICVQCHVRHILNNDVGRHSCLTVTTSWETSILQKSTWVGSAPYDQTAFWVAWGRLLWQTCFMATISVCGDIVRYFAIHWKILRPNIDRYQKRFSS